MLVLNHQDEQVLLYPDATAFMHISIQSRIVSASSQTPRPLCAIDQHSFKTICKQLTENFQFVRSESFCEEAIAWEHIALRELTH